MAIYQKVAPGFPTNWWNIDGTVVSVSPTLIVLTDTDGSRTLLHGTNLAQSTDSNGNPSYSGFITGMDRTDANGVILEQITGIIGDNHGVFPPPTSGPGYDAKWLEARLTEPNLNGLLQDVLSGTDTINGTAGDDTLRGYNGGDTVNGGAGNDTLSARGGILIGGSGSDQFLFSDPDFLPSTIADFLSGPDHIALGHTGFGNGHTGTLSDAGIEFIVAPFLSVGPLTSPYIIYNSVRHEVNWVAPNGSVSQLAKIPSGSTVTWGGSIDPGAHSTSYQVAGVADFDGDGTKDILWRNPTTGQVDEWHMASGTWAGSIDLGSHGPDWKVIGTLDLTNDGTSDVLWRNSTTGQIDEWVMAGGQWSRLIDLGSRGADWQVIGTGSSWANGVAYGEIFFRNVSTGRIDEWVIKDGHWMQSVDLGSRSADWQIAAAGDFNRDGSDDVLWRNSVTGQVDEWVMSSAKDTSGAQIGQWSQSIDLGNHGTDWQVAGVGNFDFAPLTHLGTPPSTPDFLGVDILWNNPTTGQTDIWLMELGHWAGSVGIGTHDPAFQIAGVGDLNHDSNPDILWRNPVNGQSDIWLSASVGPIHASDYVLV